MINNKAFTLIELLAFVFIIIFLRTLSLAEITDSQKKIIKSNIILVHEGMISLDEVFKKTKMFDKSGILGIGKYVMSEEEFKIFFKKESLHYGY